VQGAFDGLGLRGNDSSPVSAHATPIAEAAMLGEDGKGFEIMMDTVLPLFNVLNAACSVGLMEAAVQRTVLHASGVRYAHLDTTLADLPTIRAYIARMRIRTDMARTLITLSPSTPAGPTRCCAFFPARRQQAKRRLRS
jgi:alkylation response protein AidB-like acyl-CoA dehydrogenase